MKRHLGLQRKVLTCCILESEKELPVSEGADELAMGGNGPGGRTRGGGTPRLARSMKYRQPRKWLWLNRPSSPATTSHMSLRTSFGRPHWRKKPAQSPPCGAMPSSVKICL